MDDVLSRIDATLDGRCPCGAEPRDGSAYCCDDCVPNYHGIHTSSDTDGTQMRWRPDPGTLHLVDNREAILVAAQTYRRAMSGLAEAIQAAAARIGPMLLAASESLAALHLEPQPDHPMLRAIEQRRNRNTGPEQRLRPPRQLNPRRGR